MTIAEHWDDRTPEQQAAIEERTGWLWDYYSGKHRGHGYTERPAIFPGMRGGYARHAVSADNLRPAHRPTSGVLVFTSTSRRGGVHVWRYVAKRGYGNVWFPPAP